MVHVLEKEALCDAENVPSLMSSEELAYAKEYADNLNANFSSLLLRHMPSNFQKIDRKKAGKVSPCREV